MKKIYFLLSFNLLIINLHAQNFSWAQREGLWAYDYGYGITTDNAGNVYVGGKYEEVNANFSGTLIPCQGNHDIYVARYSPTGSLNWIRTAGGILGDYATSIACDGDSFLYVAGEIEGFGVPITFVGTSTTLTSIGFNDIFFAKYDLNGNLIWAKQEGWWHNEKALGITNDKDGNVFICGFYNDTTSFNSSLVTGYGKNDIFVAKYDMNGNFQWMQKAGSTERDEAKSIKCDPDGNVYICGLYSNGATFGSQTLSCSAGYYDAFIAKYATDGTLKWVKNAGGAYDDVAWGLTIDNANKIYITGEFNAYALFDAIPLTTGGSADIFVSCYDTTGTVQWAKQGGGPLVDRARGIGSDGTNIYITGQFGMTASFGSSAVSGVDSSEVFMAAISNSGTFLWSIAVGGVADSLETLGYESGSAICADATGSVYATGSILDGGVFGSTSFGEHGRTDIFISKISIGADTVSPTAVGFNPTDNSIGVAINSNLVLTFNEPIQKGTGNIIIKESGTTTQTIPVSSLSVTVVGNIVTINPADFSNATMVNIEIAAGAFKDMANNNYSGISDTTTWNFSTLPPNGVAKINTDNKIKIYPNPGNGNLTIDLSQLTNQSGEIRIFNGLAQEVKSVTNLSESKVNIDLSSFPNGFYFIEIQNEYGKFRDKIIIQK